MARKTEEGNIARYTQPNQNAVKGGTGMATSLRENTYSSDRNTKIARTILDQMGGNRFQVMTGAKNFAAIDRGLQFDIGRNGSQANRVRVTLRGDDTYDMQFIRKGGSVNPYTVLTKVGDKYMGKVSEKEFNAIYDRELKKAQKRAEPRVLKEYKGVYFDQLQELFTGYTKLYTRL